MTKIDLEDLERKAKAATPGTWSVDDPADPQDVLDDERDKLIVRCHRSPVQDNTVHIAANSPPVTLALITRIRELEHEVDRAASLLEERSDLGARKVWAASLRLILERGAVLP